MIPNYKKGREGYIVGKWLCGGSVVVDLVMLEVSIGAVLATVFQ